VSRAEQHDQQDIDVVFEREREGGHPLGTRLGHRAVDGRGGRCHCR